MSNLKQQTIAAEFGFSGKGLHTGADTTLRVLPADPGSGFCLRVGKEEIRITPCITDGSRHRTVVQYGKIEVHTIEHLLAALYGMGVDNAVIEVQGGEVPGLDGSSQQFAQKVREVGLAEQDADARVFNLDTSVSVAYKGASVTAFPSTDGRFRVTYILDYPESSLAQGTVDMEITPEIMLDELSPCRTFVMKCHAEALLKAGLGQGASTENTLVLDGDRVVDNELRFSDECVRHKVMDVVGDLATVGRRLGVHVVAYKSGHALNLELARKLRQEVLRVENPRGLLDIKQIEATLPHRYPFLLVDRVLEIEPLKRILAYKNVTRNEEFFNGHFPGQPIMPGVLQVEALAQTGCLLALQEKQNQGKLVVFMAVDDTKFRRPVVPGDRLMLEVVFEKLRARIGVAYGRTMVDNEIATECRIKFAMVDPVQYP